MVEAELEFAEVIAEVDEVTVLEDVVLDGLPMVAGPTRKTREGVLQHAALSRRDWQQYEAEADHPLLCPHSQTCTPLVAKLYALGSMPASRFEFRFMSALSTYEAGV